MSGLVDQKKVGVWWSENINVFDVWRTRVWSLENVWFCCLDKFWYLLSGEVLVFIILYFSGCSPENLWCLLSGGLLVLVACRTFGLLMFRRCCSLMSRVNSCLMSMLLFDVHRTRYILAQNIILVFIPTLGLLSNELRLMVYEVLLAYGVEQQYLFVVRSLDYESGGV